MAKKQTRRSVSMSRLNYEKIRREAVRRGMTIAGLIEHALSVTGVQMVSHPQQAPDRAGPPEGSRNFGRGSISMNRLNYEETKRVAALRGVSIARLIESALRSSGSLESSSKSSELEGRSSS